MAAPTIEEGSLTNARGQKLFTLTVLPAVPVVAVLVHHHGMGEYTARMTSGYSVLAEQGIAVFSFDAHSHGKSEPTDKDNKWLIWNYTDLVDDMQLVLGTAAEKLPGQPIFVSGNSMGGLVAAYTALRDQSKLAGLLLVSGLVDVEWNLVLRLQSKVGNLLASLIPRAEIVPAVRAEDMNDDPEKVKEFKADAGIQQSNVRARTGNELLKGFTGLAKQYRDLKLPIYAVHGTADRCTSLPAVKRLIAAASSTDKQLVEVQGAYHELFHSARAGEVLAGMAEWIKKHLSSTTVPVAAEAEKPAPAAQVPAVAPAAEVPAVAPAAEVPAVAPAAEVAAEAPAS